MIGPTGNLNYLASNQIQYILTKLGSLKVNEIKEAVRDRDYNQKSKLTTVIHWTLNEPSQMYHSIMAGVNGIVTDKPAELKKVLQKLKISVV